MWYVYVRKNYDCKWFLCDVKLYTTLNTCVWFPNSGCNVLMNILHYSECNFFNTKDFPPLFFYHLNCIISWCFTHTIFLFGKTVWRTVGKSQDNETKFSQKTHIPCMHHIQKNLNASTEKDPSLAISLKALLKQIKLLLNIHVKIYLTHST